MRRSPRVELLAGEGHRIRVIRVPAPRLRDPYHGPLQVSWATAFAAIAGGYLVPNAGFALLYLATGGIADST